MKKIFTLAAAVMASVCLVLAETVTFSAAEIAAGTAKSGITPYFGASVAEKNVCKDGDKQVKADVCEVKNSADTTLVNSLPSQSCVIFSASEKYITKLVVKGSFNSTGTGKKIPALYWKGTTRTEAFDGAELVAFDGYDQSCENGYYTFGNMPEKTQMAGIFKRIKVDDATTPTKKMNSKGVNYGDGQTFYVQEVEVTYLNTCEDPEFTVPKGGAGYVGDPIDLAITSNNDSKPVNYAVTVDGVEGVIGTDYSFSVSLGLVKATPLKAGTFVITFSQATDGTYCAAEESATFVISEKTPVSACSIDGPTAGYKGNKVTYTATAAGATEYRWTVDGAIQEGAESATFEFTPSASRTYKIVGQARNDFNATSEWISSDPISLTVTSLYGEIIAVTRNEKVLNEVTGIIGGTAKKSTQDNGKLGATGHYWSLTLASGNFNAGDTVVVNVSAAAQQGTITVTSDQAAADVLGTTEDFGVVGDNKVILTKGDVNTIWVVRTDANKWNGVIDGIRVVRPMPVKSTAESLTAVKVDGVAISSEDLATLLSSTHKVNLAASYAAAPEVEFNKHIVKTFEDDSQKESDEAIKVTASKNALKRWEAKATINAIEYTVTAGVNASATITYMYGEKKLGEEVVAINGNPANYAGYQNEQLATFKGWYSDMALTSAVTIASAVIDKDTTFYAKFENAYASSVNIEKLVLDNGTKYDLMGYMGGLNYATNIENSLDTLNDLENKDNRNYAYLGLKVKAAGKLLDFRLADGATLKVKFGAYKSGKEPQVSINGAAYAAMEITDGVYSHTASGDELVSIKTATADAVVFQQIMYNEDLKVVELPAPGAYLVTCAEAENGTVTAAWPNKKYRTPVGETVTLTVTPNDGYKVADVKVNGESLNAVEGVYSFPMPAQDVTVVATFSVVTAIDNTEAAVKATKVVRDGQLYIEKNGVLYNAQGAVVK